jgi:hypothetical protein
MAQYYGSPYGTIRGSIGPLVFSCNKGRHIISLKLPLEINALNTIRKSTKMQNSKTLMALLMKLYHLIVKPQLSAYWKDRLLPLNALIVKENMSILHHSIPDRTKLCDENNLFDISQLQLTFKPTIYEPPARITSLRYTDNQLQIKWDTKTYKDGTPDDIAHIVIIYCQPFSRTYAPKLDMNNPIPLNIPENRTAPSVVAELALPICPAPSVVAELALPICPENRTILVTKLKVFSNSAIRAQGEATVITESNLNPKFLNVFIFFSNKTSHSQTTGVNLLKFSPPEFLSSG